jgi:tetratricopeptide (TPR) repeat protein
MSISCATRETARPHVVVISIDTLRSDRLPAYGYGGTKTPSIDRLAADGIVFENAWSHVPLTLPSHASVMTGLLPPEHGVRDNAGQRLDPKTPTIATLLRANGYATGGGVSAYVLRQSTGIASGFDSYDDQIAFVEGAPTGNLRRSGRETVRLARDWIESHRASPFFLFVHLFEPHAPYEGGSYDAAVAKADEAVGELLDKLRQRKIYDDTLVILLSDHGEGLRDHGEQEHGVLLYREALQVPLIVKLPRSERRGERVPALAQLIDVLPTILDATKTTPPASLRGQSLLGDLGNRTSYAETLYPRIHLGWSELRSIVDWPIHLIDGPKPELYRVAADRREQTNVLDANRRDFTRLRAQLEAMPKAAVTAQRIDAEEARKLAALGYVSGGAAKASDLNPRDHLADLDALKSVSTKMAGRRFAEAAKEMEALLARNPGWSDLRDQLGVAYESLGDLESAERTYREAIRATPELGPDFALSLARILLARGKLDDAERHARIAEATNPGGAKLILAQVLVARRDLPAALAMLHGVAAPRADFVRGDILARLNRTAEARTAFEKAIAADPRHVDAYIALALVFRIEGNVAASRATLERMVAAMPETRALAEKRMREWQ